MARYLLRLTFIVVSFCLLLSPLDATEIPEDVEKLLTKYSKEKMLLDESRIEDKDYIKSIIHKMYERDQELRKSYAKYVRTEIFDLNFAAKCSAATDIPHTKIIKHILNDYGWLTISEFGGEIDRKAWLLVQHADHDLAFQRKVLTHLEKLKDSKETASQNYALLCDRVLCAQKKKQRFGTQVEFPEGKVLVKEYEGDLKSLNQRRQMIGLEPMEDYLTKLKKMLK